MGGALRCLEVHWAIGCTVYLEPASKNCAEGFALNKVLFITLAMWAVVGLGAVILQSHGECWCGLTVCHCYFS